MTDAERSASPLIFFLVPFSVAVLAPLMIWEALTFPNYLALGLAVPFAALLAWSGIKVVRA